MRSKHAEYLDTITRHAADDYNVVSDLPSSVENTPAPVEEEIHLDLPSWGGLEEDAAYQQYVKPSAPAVQHEFQNMQYALQPGDKIVEPTEEELDLGLSVFGEEPESVGQVFYEFQPEFPEALALAYSKTDVSFDSLLYLRSLGYNYAQWQLSSYRGRIIYDICDVYSGRFFTLDTLLNDARNHAAGGSTPGNWKPHKPYNPPAPIFAQSHPGCGCSIICIKPKSISEIPNDAPGVPYTTNSQIINDARRMLLGSLQDELVNHHTYIDVSKAQQLQLKPLSFQLAKAQEYTGKGITQEIPEEAKKYQRNRHVRKWTPTYQFANVGNLPYTQEPSEPAREEAHASYKTRMKFAANVHLPVVVTESIMYASNSGLITPISRGYRGFIIDKGEEVSRVYLVQLNHIIELPNDVLQELKLRPSKYDSGKMYGGIYIFVDDMLGITFKVYGDKEKSRYALVYMPEMNDLIEVSQWTTLEMI